MKKVVISVSLVVFMIGILSVSQVFAIDFGDEITQFDGVARPGWGRYTPWWNSTDEDQEVEHGNQLGQVWDLEGMFLKGTQLSLVGGYDFKNGYHSRYTGDIFIDVTGDMTYGQDIINIRRNGNKRISNVFGYDYVIDISKGKTFNKQDGEYTYNVYEIDEKATLLSPYWRSNDEAGAYRYDKGGKLVGSGTLMYQTGLTDIETGFMGGSHNLLSVDLGFLNSGTTFSAHYTMGCGNDDLIGSGTITPTATPEPGTLLLLGGGVLALLGIIKKRAS